MTTIKPTGDAEFDARLESVARLPRDVLKRLGEEFREDTKKRNAEVAERKAAAARERFAQANAARALAVNAVRAAADELARTHEAARKATEAARALLPAGDTLPADFALQPIGAYVR